jgi:hypothetical protein
MARQTTGHAALHPSLDAALVRESRQDQHSVRHGL